MYSVNEDGSDLTASEEICILERIKKEVGDVPILELSVFSPDTILKAPGKHDCIIFHCGKTGHSGSRLIGLTIDQPQTDTITSPEPRLGKITEKYNEKGQLIEKVTDFI